MRKTFDDPLLMMAKALLGALILLLGAITVMLVLATLAIPFLGDELSPDLLAEGRTALTGTDVAILTAFVAGLAALVALLTYFMRLLWQIVTSVGEGDPFVPENADRLSRMAWAMVGIWIVGLGVVLAGLRAEGSYTDATHTFDVMFDGIDVGSILLVLVLFILARVFRHGAAMREDLEGTV